MAEYYYLDSLHCYYVCNIVPERQYVVEVWHMLGRYFEHYIV